MSNVMELASNAVRGCIVAPPGKKLVVADLSNIEGRGLAWLAGEEWKLQAFRAYDAGEGPDLYILAYARSFNVDPAKVTKTGRQIGKVMELALGYQGGVAAFLTFAAVYQMDLDAMADAVHRTAPKDVLAAAYGVWEWAVKNKRTLGLSKSVYVACEALKAMWRAAHPATVALWDELGEGVVNATLNPGQVYTAGPHLKIVRNGSWLRIRLPSGRYLCYLRPEVDEQGGWSYMGVNQYTRQWTRIRSYAGKCAENSCQSWALDVLTENMKQIEDSGYKIVLSVHDELLTECPDTPDFTADALGGMMSRRPPWAPDVPLAAAGFETDRYYKD